MKAGITGCVFAAIVRDTREVVLTHEQRFNHFPAGPFCGVTRILEGDCHTLDDSDQVARPWSAPLVPRIAFSGPQRY